MDNSPVPANDGARSKPRLVADIDLGMLAEALNDHGDYITWWFDVTTGDTIADADGELTDEDEPTGELAGHELIAVGSEGSHEAYRDMDRFVSWVADAVVQKRLQRALEGRGAFRRFKDELYSVPGFYRERWFDYSRYREEERAIDWLRFRGVVDTDDADREAAERERLAVAVLDEVEGHGGLRIDVSEAPARWAEIMAAIERGEPVELIRDGATFAFVTHDE